MTAEPFIPVNLDGSGMRFGNDVRIRFFEAEHRYSTVEGRPLLPVSSLIARFFRPFEEDYWAERKAAQRGVAKERILEEWELKRLKASGVGTYMHAQIERFFRKEQTDMAYRFDFEGNYLSRHETVDISTEFAYFRRFLASRKLEPFRVEWRVFDENAGVAGTLDLVCRRGDVFDIYDWKRSGKLPDSNRFQCGLGGLSHLEDSSFVRYCLQQNLYRHILEHSYGIRIGQMTLVVLHPDLEDFRILDVPRMDDEVEYMLREACNAD